MSKGVYDYGLSGQRCGHRLVEKIKQSIKEAEAGEFASDADLAIATKKYAR
jgi:hypothetical protein